jgi:sterol desaturase/sphingolipid hydroxylase (fatty acid hydroxylase superfamily)
MGLLLLILLVVLLMGGLPRWGYSQGWGYGPSGLVGLLLVVLVVMLFMDVVHFSRF